MMITAEKIKPYLEDYEKVTGNATDRFICPITLKECETAELIEGHILNKGFNKASPRRIVQYGDIDSFYGTRVEESFVEYVNSKDHDAAQVIAAAECLEMHFEDGSTAPCFSTAGASARHAESKFPKVSSVINGVEQTIFIDTSHDDPRLNLKMNLHCKSRQFPPAHWTATMLKAGHLALFDMLGYCAVFSPFGDTLRRTLKGYYTDKASRNDAERYFSDFKFATKLVVSAGTLDEAIRGHRKPVPFDTLASNELLFHRTPSGTFFAVSCVFQINDVAAIVTLPEALNSGDVETVWSYYSRLVNDEHPPQQVHLAKYQAGEVVVSKEQLNVHLIPDNEVRALLESR